MFFVLFCVFFCHQFIFSFTEGVQLIIIGFISEQLYFLKVSEEGVIQLFPGGGGGRIQILTSMETHITCDFPGGGVRTPYTPSGSAHVATL